MSPLAWTLQAMLDPAALALSLLVKWWTVWFVLGRNFSRTTAMVIGALLLTAGFSWLSWSSGALGPELQGGSSGREEHLSSFSWFVAWGLAGVVTLALETSWLRFCMARLVRSDWRWRHYDRAGYALAHFACLAAAVVYGLWQAGAVRVS